MPSSSTDGFSIPVGQQHVTKRLDFDLLLQRILDARPLPLSLAADELAALNAYLGSLPPNRPSYKRLQQDAFAGRSTHQDELDAENSRRAYLKEVVKYNEKARQCQTVNQGEDAAKQLSEVPPATETAEAIRNRGAKPLSHERIEEYRKIIEDWNRAKDAGVAKEDFCKTPGPTKKTLENAQSYFRNLKAKKRSAQ